ncbi:MAG: hypothetical protein ACRDJ5_08250, partial [Actinomycetota bacterium]
MTAIRPEPGHAAHAGRAETQDAAFYCVSSGEYFLGAVGLINSLRLVGHTETIYLLDCGLSDAQRELLASEVTVVPAPTGTPPYLLKTVVPLAHPRDVRVLIDVDMVVTRPLTGLIREASQGKVIAFQNRIDRFVPEWGELLDLGPIRRAPYLSSGLVLLGGAVGEEVLELWHDRQRVVEYERGCFAEKVEDYPFLFLDQDVLNAILATRPQPGLIEALDLRLAPVPPFRGLEVRDPLALRCSYSDGIEPYVVHQYLPRKPWLDLAYDGVYSQMLRRLLTGPELAIRVPPREIPLRMRSGALAYA